MSFEAIKITYATTTSTFKEFIAFLYEQKILQIALAFVIGTQVNNLANGFIDSFIVPIINRLLQSDKAKKLADYTVTIAGIKFQIGSFIVLLLQFFIFLFLLFLMVLYLPKLLLGTSASTLPSTSITVQSASTASPAPASTAKKL